MTNVRGRRNFITCTISFQECFFYSHANSILFLNLQSFPLRMRSFSVFIYYYLCFSVKCWANNLSADKQHTNIGNLQTFATVIIVSISKFVLKPLLPKLPISTIHFQCGVGNVLRTKISLAYMTFYYFGIMCKFLVAFYLGI